MAVPQIMESNSRQTRLGNEAFPFLRQRIWLQWQAIRSGDDERLVGHPDTEPEQLLRLAQPMGAQFLDHHGR